MKGKCKGGMKGKPPKGMPMMKGKGPKKGGKKKGK